MVRRLLVALALAASLGVPTGALADPADLIVKETTLAPEDAAKRIVAAIGEAGGLIVAELDHSRADEETVTELRFNRTIAFNRAELITSLLAKNPAAAIELPLRIGIFSDGTVTRIVYRDPAAMKKDWNVEGIVGVVDNITGMMDQVTQKGVEGR